MTSICFDLKSNFHDSSLKVYQGFLGQIAGWILSCFGEAYRIADGHESYYVNADSVLKSLVPLQEFRSLKVRFSEALQPILGVSITWQTIGKLRGVLQHARTREEAELALERFKHRKLELLSYQDMEQLQARLQPGDMLFKKIPDDRTHVVSLGQRVIRPLISGIKEREAFKFSHVAMYIGEGKIAEATPTRGGPEVRILSLDDPRFAHQGEGFKFVVSRLKDASLAVDAALVAAKTAVVPDTSEVESCKKSPFKYTVLQALRSVWHPDNFGWSARYRYLKQYIDDHRSQPPVDFLGLKKFFCSYFIGFCLQTAESRRIMPKIVGEEDGPLQVPTYLGNAISRGLWARIRSLQFWQPMSEQISMQFDAKRLTPQGLRNIVVRNPSLFEDKFLVDACLPSALQQLA